MTCRGLTYDTHIDNMYRYIDKNNNHTHVMYYDPHEYKQADMNILTDTYDNVIVIYDPNQVKHIHHIKPTIELIPLYRLCYNPTKHVLTPKHERIDVHELPSIVQPHQLPILLTSDVMCVWFGFKVGDIIKITRKNGTIIYRRVE